jgi:hypothetical protein
MAVVGRLVALLVTPDFTAVTVQDIKAPWSGAPRRRVAAVAPAIALPLRLH